LAFCLILVAAGGAWAQAPMMRGVDLPGGDFESFMTKDPSRCRLSCQGEGRCVAWTWVLPSVPGADGTCWLKSRVPPQQANNCCISGIERNPMHSGILNNTDLPGRDLRSLWTADAAQCRAVCRGDEQCRAWTWVRPAVRGESGACWIKGSVPPREQNDCCISAVER
jgi:hypothetical protein